MFFKIGALKNFANLTRKTPALGSPFEKTSSPQAFSFIKKKLQHRRPPLNPRNLQEHSLLQNRTENTTLLENNKTFNF